MSEEESIPQPKFPKVIVPEICVIPDTSMVPPSEVQYPPLAQGVIEMDYSRAAAEQIARLETQIYDNPKLITGVEGFANKFDAVRRYNEAFGKPSLSFMHTDETGAPNSYIFAFEGVLQPEGAPSPNDQGVVYIFDLASSVRGGGAVVLSEFLKRYKAVYNGEPFPPIFIKARESTSYPLIKPHAARMSRFLGIEIGIDEIALEQRNDDVMHHLLIHQQ